MINKFLAIAAIVALSACSSGGSDPTPTDPNDGPQDGGNPPAGDGGNPPGNPGNPGGTPPSAGDGNPPAAGTSAGTYVGDFGNGSGVFVIDNDNRLSGLALAANGSGVSVFADLGAQSNFQGTARRYFHEESKPDQSSGTFGAGNVSTDTPLAVNLNIIAGQTIQSLDGNPVSLTAASAGQLTPISASSLAGDWTASHQFCGNDGCSQLVTQLNFNGTQITGSTEIFTDGTGDFRVPIAGSTTDFGDVVLVGFSWGGSIYNGVAMAATDGSGRIVFVGETAAEVERKTIGALLSR